jgi:acetyl-CoA carboxylase biotin carboxyl carrier protein
MEMDRKLIESLLDAFDRSDWQEMTVTIGGDRLHVSRREESDGAAAAVAPPSAAAPPSVEAPRPATPSAPPPAPADAPGPPAARAVAPPVGVHAEQLHAAGQPLTGTVVESPSVGLFWRAPSPGAPPFVELGASVSAGDTLAIVEVMKLMNHIVAPVDGTVKAILAENGETVEYGQPLFVLDPGA